MEGTPEHHRRQTCEREPEKPHHREKGKGQAGPGISNGEDKARGQPLPLPGGVGGSAPWQGLIRHLGAPAEPAAQGRPNDFLERQR